MHQVVQPADHHYVPKFYLKGFTDEKKVLWVHEKNKAPRRSTPKAEGNRDNYYTFSDRGVADDSVEKLLSKAESLVAPTINKLRNPQFAMTDMKRDELYAFIAMTFVRVPAYREFIDRYSSELMKKMTQEHARDADKFDKSLRKFEKESGQSLGDHQKLREFALSDNYTVTQKSAGFNLLLAFEASLEITEILEREYKYDVWYAPRDLFFMTCDNPIVVLRPDVDGTAFVGSGFGWPDAQVLFPLNKRACLVLRRRGRGERIEATERRVEQINGMIMGVAQQYLYAPRGYKRITRIFNERGCKIKYGGNALMTSPVIGP